MGTRSYFGLVAVVAALAMMACNSPRRGGGGGGGGEDSGRPPVDGGPTGTDSGPTGTDSGPTGTDSGPTPECSTSFDCADGEECISGSCEPVTTSCPSDVIPTTGPFCALATAECWDGCGGDSACQQGCLDDDPDAANCNGCVNQNIISCINAAGCQDEWNCFSACVDEFGCTDRACALANCGPEDTAWNDCADGLTGLDCNSEFAMCFMTS